MTEIIKTIIAELAKEPFKKKFTVISFDSLTPELLLQVLNDVLSEIEPTNRIDIREEAVEETVIRMLHMLRVLKYKPPENDPSTLRAGLVNGNPNVIYPILLWLLPRMNELKTRAYLAKFLVKVDVPEEMRADIEVEELYQQYEGLMEQFKTAHKQLETMKVKGFTTSEIRKDIQAMESEQESVQRKIEKLKQRTEGTPNLNILLEVVRNYRKEKEHSRELNDQCLSQTQTLANAEQRIQRLQRQLKEIQQAGTGTTGQGILQRLEDDTNVARFIVHDKLPKEISSERKIVDVYNKVLDENYDTHDLEDKKSEVELLKKEVNEMIMKRMMKTEDDKLVMFRQQTAIVANKKMSLVEKLNENRSDLQSLKEEIEEKKAILEKLQGDANMNEEDFKDYVKDLRIKSTRFKQMKSHLAYLKSESGILAKTLYILEQEFKETQLNLTAAEARLGMKGYVNIHENLEKVSNEKSNLDEVKSRNLQEMSTTVQELHDRISMKKIDLAPLVKSLNAKRQQSQIITHEYENRKRTFDGLVASLQAGISRIEKEVESQRKQYEENQLNYCKLTAQINKHKVDLGRMQDELKIYTGKGGESGKKSLKDTLLSKISEQDRCAKALKDEERGLQVKQDQRVRQAQLWRNVVKLMESKLDIERKSGSAS